MLGFLRSYLLSLILILAGALLSGLFFRTVAEKTVLDEATILAQTAFVQVFTQDVWYPYEDTIASFNVSKNQAKEWLADQSFLGFLQTIEKLAKGLAMPVIKFQLYKADGSLFFTSESENLEDNVGWLAHIASWVGLSEPDAALELQHILQDHLPHGSVVADARYKVADSNWQNGPVMVSFLPLMGKDGLTFEGVLELNQAIDQPWHNLLDLQLVTTISTFLIFLVLFVLLVFHSKRVEKIIDKQQEINVELASAKARAESESQEKSKFLANVSHELRTPLNAIIGFSEIIKSEAMGPLNNPTYKDYVTDIHNSGTHLLSLINDILDFSKAEAQKLVVESIPINVGKVARSTVRLMEARASQGQVKLITDVPKDDLVILGDQKRLKQILLNLLSNAVKFTPENGSITVRVQCDLEAKTVEMQVTDTGIGIPAKDIARAMAVFGQVDNKLSRKYEGTGLGLPLTKKLVELMNGRFNIMSQEGFGTTVTTTFPLHERIMHADTSTEIPAVTAPAATPLASDPIPAVTAPIPPVVEPVPTLASEPAPSLQASEPMTATTATSAPAASEPTASNTLNSDSNF